MKPIALILAPVYQLSEGEILVITSVLDFLAYRTVIKRTQKRCPVPLANTRQSRARIEKNRVAVETTEVWQPSKEEIENRLRKKNEGLALDGLLFFTPYDCSHQLPMLFGYCECKSQLCEWMYSHAAGCCHRPAELRIHLRWGRDISVCDLCVDKTDYKYAIVADLRGDYSEAKWWSDEL